MARVKNRKCVIYARASAGDQGDDKASTSMQKARIIRCIESCGGEYLKTYVEAMSGTIRTSRPVYQEMLADAQTGKFDVIVTMSVCRMSREKFDYLQAQAEFREIGVELISMIAESPNDLVEELAFSAVTSSVTS